jgi:hypothetical protein
MNDIWIAHHGIKGQKWGVRRFQNPDGTYTKEGLERLRYSKQARNASKTKSDVEFIINSMSKDDRDKVLAGSDHYLTVEEGASVCKRVLKKDGDKPIAFFDILEDGDELQIALGTRSGKRYRGKGYGSEVAKEGMDWIESNKDKVKQKTVVWGVRTDNIGSIKIAEKNGFVRDDSSERDGWVNYTKRIKH